MSRLARFANNATWEPTHRSAEVPARIGWISQQPVLLGLPASLGCLERIGLLEAFVCQFTYARPREVCAQFPCLDLSSKGPDRNGEEPVAILRLTRQTLNAFGQLVFLDQSLDMTVGAGAFGLLKNVADDQGLFLAGWIHFLLLLVVTDIRNVILG